MQGNAIKLATDCVMADTLPRYYDTCSPNHRCLELALSGIPS